MKQQRTPTTLIQLIEEVDHLKALRASLKETHPEIELLTLKVMDLEPHLLFELRNHINELPKEDKNRFLSFFDKDAEVAFSYGRLRLALMGSEITLYSKRVKKREQTPEVNQYEVIQEDQQEGQ